MKTMLIASLGLTCVAMSTVLAAEPTREQPQQQPAAGGGGCLSRGTCKGTLYGDVSNLYRWWYPICSGCHVVQAPQPAGVSASFTPFQRDLLASKARFAAFHADAEADPVLRRLTPKTRMVPTKSVPPPYRDLLGR